MRTIVLVILYLHFVTPFRPHLRCFNVVGVNSDAVVSSLFVCHVNEPFEYTICGNWIVRFGEFFETFMILHIPSRCA